MRKYKHLTLEQREAIECMHHSGLSPRVIASRLGVCHQTIYRELERGNTENGYRAQAGQSRYEEQFQSKGRKPMIENNVKLQEFIRREILENGKSIESISKELSSLGKESGLSGASYGTIYRAIQLGYIPGISKETFLNRLATIQKDGSLYIPKWFLEKYGLTHGQQFEISYDGDHIILKMLKDS